METRSAQLADDYYNQIMGLTEDTLYQQEYITSEYERRLGLVELEYEITRKRVDLEKKQLELSNVLNEKNTKMYINGSWTQVANSEDVRNASEAVADAEKEAKLDEQKMRQQMQTNQMKEYIDSLKESQSKLENSLNYTSVTNEELIGKISGFITEITGGDLDTTNLSSVIKSTTDIISEYQQSLKTFKDTTISSAIDVINNVSTSLQNFVDKTYNYTDELMTNAENQNDRLTTINDNVYDSTSELTTKFKLLNIAIQNVIDTYKEEKQVTSIPSDIHEMVNEVQYLKSEIEKEIANAKKEGREPNQEY